MNGILVDKMYEIKLANLDNIGYITVDIVTAITPTANIFNLFA